MLQCREAFVYCWTDHKTNKLYVGYHRGQQDDGYVCSSKWMLEEYNKRPEDFTRMILAEGTAEDCRALEETILVAVDAARSDRFYNQHNGGKNFVLDHHTEETRNKMSVTHKEKGLKPPLRTGKIFITNGEKVTLHPKNEKMPIGWREHNIVENLKWINDGNSNRRINLDKENIPEGWKLGRSIFSDVTRQHMSSSRHVTPELKIKLSAASSGVNNPQYGKNAYHFEGKQQFYLPGRQPAEWIKGGLPRKNK